MNYTMASGIIPVPMKYKQDTKVLIIGNGRAGKRHAKHAKQLGLEIITCDPYQPADYRNWFHALSVENITHAVIASPPKMHLSQITGCLRNKVKVLCEKPLCDNGQLNTNTISVINELIQNQQPVMVAYNWLYNDAVINYKLDTTKHSYYHLYAEQARELPEWGLAYDHLGHDFSIMTKITGGIDCIKSVDHIIDEKEELEAYHIEGLTTAGIKFIIDERVYSPKRKIARFAKINNTLLYPDEYMFLNMWHNFMSDKYYPGLAKALEIQKLIDLTLQIAGK